ncbi:MAG: RluA family pseudouridine synthase [Xanthomonadales bacterium]|jgi:23S rRNA pseudouridine955/2504/2580 synthase|nr:RluA family pseudouridine synthase [Xanthomonadales bacterium]
MPTNDNHSGVRMVHVDADRQGQRVDNFLSNLLKGVPRAAVYRMIRTGQVRINGGRCKPATRLEAGDEVRVPPAHTRGQREVIVSDNVLVQVREAILHEDKDLLVVNKPAGMAVHAGSGLPWGLIDALRQDRPGEYLELAHRLDRETSGCLVLARNGPALNHLSAQFREGLVRKFYLCLMDGRLPEDLVEVDAPLSRTDAESRGPVVVQPDGKPARTRFRLLERFHGASYVEAELLTGRTHQIRAHARHIGLPLAGDAKYSDRESLKRWKKQGLGRLFLHAHRLGLGAPSGEHMEFNAVLPGSLREVLDRLQR